MRYLLHTFLISSLFISTILQGQEWKLYTASDAVKDFRAYKGELWITSGSGLSRLNMTTFEKSNWNTVNSALPDYYYNRIAIDSTGKIWLGVRGSTYSSIALFDGVTFETIKDIHGKAINNLLDIEVTPDGIVWLLANTIPNRLYKYDQSTFTAIPLPGPSFTYHRNSNANICAGTNNHVWAILDDEAIDKHYIGEYDGSTWILHDVSTLEIKPEGEDNWAVDQEGNVYLFCRNTDMPKLLKYDGQTWITITLPQSATEARYINEPFSIDDLDQIRILLNNNSILHHDGIQWNTIQLPTLGFVEGQPRYLYVDTGENWWIAYDQQTDYFELTKLYRYDGTSPEHIDLSNSDLPTNELYSILIDELNNKWMQSPMGLLKYNGEEWNSISFPLDLDLYSPLGSDRSGGVWLETYNNNIALFDGLTVHTFPVLSHHGGAIAWVEDFEVDSKGRIFACPYESKIMVFDHGQITYLNQTIRYIDPEFSFPDYPNALAFNPNGRLYALGSQLYEFQADSSWIPFPLWDESGYGYDMSVAPDSIVWVAELNGGPGYIFHLFNGSSWSLFDSPFEFRSLPRWDSYGIPWFITDQGLCKYANQTWTCYNRSNSPIVQERIDDFAIDEYDNIWIDHRDGGLLLLNEKAIQYVNGEELPSVSGQVYRDVNQNGVFDTGDTPLAFQRELMLPENTIAFSRFDASYRMSAANGEHEVRYIPRPNWHIDNSPESYQIQIADSSISNLNFALAPDEDIVDLSLFLAEGFPRCNSTSRYTLSYLNLGTMSEDVLVTLVLDPAVTIENIQPQPDAISGDTLSWNKSNLLPFASSQIRLDLRIPGVEQTMITFHGYVDRITGQVHERVDSVSVTQEVRCSFDPNDKLSRSTRVSDSGQFHINDIINYTIRFQNTGNDTAFQIVIRDTLDSDLDLATLEIISASHPYEAFLKSDRTLEFRFHNILLPDSSTNEMESHGFVSYQIKAKAGLPTPTIIQNSAHIYFDYNGSIQTNTTVNELVEFVTGMFNEVNLNRFIRAYPNPARNELLIESLSMEHVPIHYYLKGADGTPLLSGTILPGETQSLSTSPLPSGVYILHTNSGQLIGSMIVVKVD